ncbi:MAG: hypothetical protein JWO73_870, partial [Candidatus Taylorbacteria bacterium]|nr:hypothetical protein [Candidatus Taylorbacteria bacterium]
NTVSSRNEGVITKEALTKMDPTILKELDPIIASYKIILKELIATPAPQPLFANHKKLVNTLSSLVFITESYKKSDVDPILTIQGIGRSQDVMIALFDALKTIRSYMAAAGVSFKLK